jgi:hypothetical protein
MLTIMPMMRSIAELAITITHLLLAKEVGACVTDTPPFFRGRMIALGSSPYDDVRFDLDQLILIGLKQQSMG